MVTIDDLRDAQASLESAARGFEPSARSGQEAVEIVEVVGVIRRLADAILGKAAKRVESTAAHTYGTDRSAAELCVRLVGVDAGEAKRAIDVATKLESLPATDAAVRAGLLSARAAELIASTASGDPAVEADLLRVAPRGVVPLRDACIAVRAEREDESERSTRQHASRSFRSWTSADGMVEGRFRVVPEVGGAIRARIEAGTRRRFREARRDGPHESQDAYAADAFAAAVLGGTAATGRGGYTTHVVIEHEALVRGHAVGGERCEIPGVGPVSVEWVRHLLGEAFVTAVVRKGRDITTVAHLGRHVPAELRTAMIVAGRECSVEGCSGREYLELDHCETDFAEGGATEWKNLAWLCSVHHTRKSQGWILGPPDPVSGRRSLAPSRNEAGRAA